MSAIRKKIMAVILFILINPGISATSSNMSERSISYKRLEEGSSSSALNESQTTKGWKSHAKKVGAGAASSVATGLVYYIFKKM